MPPDPSHLRSQSFAPETGLAAHVLSMPHGQPVTKALPNGSRPVQPALCHLTGATNVLAPGRVLWPVTQAGLVWAVRLSPARGAEWSVSGSNRLRLLRNPRCRVRLPTPATLRPPGETGSGAAAPAPDERSHPRPARHCAPPAWLVPRRTRGRSAQVRGTGSSPAPRARRSARAAAELPQCRADSAGTARW